MTIMTAADVFDAHGHNTLARTNAHPFFPPSCTSLSQFIGVSHPQVEALNLDSSVTQPQLSPTAATVIVARLQPNRRT